VWFALEELRIDALCRTYRFAFGDSLGNIRLRLSPLGQESRVLGSQLCRFVGVVGDGLEARLVICLYADLAVACDEDFGWIDFNSG
jgi:hypothetical protein